MNRALLYCTFNGIANCTNGIGRQAATLLTTLSRRWDELTSITGPFTPYIAIPQPGPATWAYNPAQLARASAIIEMRGGRIIPLPYDTRAGFWSPATWQQLSRHASDAAAWLASRHSHVGVIAVDTPFAGTGNAFLTRHPAAADAGTVTVLLTLYGTAHIHDHPAPGAARLAWEHASLTAARHATVRVADIGDFLTSHLTSTYAVPASSLIPWRSSLDLTAPDLQPMSPDQAARMAAEYAIPDERPVIATIGRTDPAKGIDLLIDAVAPLRNRVHLVAIVVPFNDHDPLLSAYQRQIARLSLPATLVPRFTRDLPRALAALPRTAAVACPSRGEPLANVPFEVALWARHGGPVVVAPDRDGFREQVTHRRTGLLYDPRLPGALTSALADAITLAPADRARICDAAYREVASTRDVVTNLAPCLRRILSREPGVR
ncbi:MAG: glycosyltransferase family 4 protein [Nocardiopsaceae bacterium]|nr:glycosyltransferase family 4 protein [Nocardiopsaceae bacterium]